MKDSQNPVLLSLGGNLGDVASAFERAAAELEQNGFRILKRSRLFRSRAMGCEDGAPDFLNCSILGIWEKPLLRLLELIHRIEVECGRPADHPHWVSRTLDIDIITAGTLEQKTPELTIPHPELANRDFVLIPSAEIAPDMNIPGVSMSFSELLLKRKKQNDTLNKKETSK